MKNQLFSKIGKSLGAGALCLTLLLGTAGGLSPKVWAEDGNGDTLSPKYQSTIPDWALKEAHEYTVDFASPDKKAYQDESCPIRLVDASGLDLKDGGVRCKAKKTYVIAGKNYLGDRYGISGGRLEFSLSLTGGTFVVYLRDAADEPARADSCLRLEFKNGALNVIDRTCNQKCKEIATGLFADGNPHTITVEDRILEIAVKYDGNVIAKIGYSEGKQYSVSNYSSSLSVYDGAGRLAGSWTESKLQRAGFFVLVADSAEGVLDDLKYTYNEIDTALPEASEPRTVSYANWVAADDLNRTVPLNDTVGNPKSGRYVGMFYFLCWTGAGGKVTDVTKKYLEMGSEELSRFLTKSGGEVYWAEPYFGYYRNTDTWVYRKHAYMLDAAGIDFIFLDVSNAVTFDNAMVKLFDTWLQIRKEGGHTPQICLLTGDNSHTLDVDVANVRKTVYAPENWDKYKELFFLWNGKPLLFGNISEASPETKEFLKDFEVRGCWAWCNKDGYWNWLEELNLNEVTGKWEMYRGRDENGKFEQLAISLGHHASTSKGRSFVKGQQPTDGLRDFEFQLASTKEGLGFASQADYALETAPECVMITGWNEWIAGNCRGSSFMANTPVNDVCYVDEFNPEFSRDGEPMKIRDGVGFGDNYYYQIVDFVRRYKGLDKVEKATGQESVDVSLGEEAWAKVGPEFRDTVGDAEFRNTPSYDLTFRYINATGRNDLDWAKVSQDQDNLYFAVKTVNPIVSAGDSSWMNLYLDTDMDHTTGWEGYDFVINREREGNQAFVERFTKGSWDGETVGKAEFSVTGNLMTVTVKKTDLGFAQGKSVNFDFKWADNSTETGSVMEFMDLGDTAPNDRFNFRFVSDSFAYRKKVQRENGKLPGFLPFAIGGGVLAAAGITVLAVLLAKKKKKG